MNPRYGTIGFELFASDLGAEDDGAKARDWFSMSLVNRRSARNLLYALCMIEAAQEATASCH